MIADAGYLPEGGRVLVIGGGPGGTACALALHRLAVEMNRSVQILLLEGKQFTEERHYNQCAGVLAHPLAGLLEEQLGVPFPYYHLCRERVPGSDGITAFGPYIHAFLTCHPRIEFGAITPKGNHLTINTAGQEVDANLMQAFLDHPNVRAVLPNLPSRLYLHPACRQAWELREGVWECADSRHPKDLRFFKGRFPRSLAGGYYGDRYVMVGDAAGLVRAFKGKEVTSAVQTGIRAAQTILLAGITKQAFEWHYRMANSDIINDLPYGQGMRLLTILAARYGLVGPVLRAARQDPAVRSALFDAVSAHAPYRQVLFQVLRPRSLLAILRAMCSDSE